MELKKITQEELDNMLELHEKWLNHKEDGVQLDLSYEDLKELDFSNHNLKNACFYKANLAYSKFNCVFSIDSNFSGADLTGAEINYSDFSYSNFSYSNLSCCNAKNSDFSCCDVTYCDILHSDFSYSRFICSDLSDSTFTYSNLSDVDTYKTNFSYSDLRNTVLKNINLDQASLLYAKVDDMISVGNIGEEYRTVYYFYKEDRVICGCFDNNLEEFEKAVRKKYKFNNESYNMCLKVFKEYKNE